jgi:sulfite reductase (NADPH) flavoprotein alpha-component
MTMNPIPFIPENAPFTPEQRQWLNGYLAGFFSHAGGASAAFQSTPAAALEAPKPLLLLYGSQTGTAEGLAKKTAKAAQSRGFAPKLLCMEKFDSADLAKEERVLVITSTYGDGDPPDNAQAFWNWLAADTAPRFEQTAFSVLALGDTNYPMFCEFGKKCDTRLEQLGAKRVTPRVDCDVDYEEAAKGWTEAVLAALGTGAVNPATEVVATPAPKVMEGFSRKNPFGARLATNRKLTRDGSEKDVRHFEIALTGSGMSYEVGDALGVMPSNCPDQVSELLAVVGCDGEEGVLAPDGGEVPLRLALLQHYDITKPSPDLLKCIAERHANGDLAPLLDGARREDLKKYLWGREVIDLVAGVPKRFNAGEFVSVLKKLQPRLYSISSSLKAHPDEVHLTVGSVRYSAHGRDRRGVCSIFLADRCLADTAVPVWVQPSHGFKLPVDGARDIIMVGPGTGIAPFRAFLQERRVTGASGRNWLFFGDQRRTFDYLYEDALEAWRADGHLNRLDLAFSRDQADKIYVQHRMTEAAAELWSWLEGGAHFYVCGDASRMAKDVDAALHRACELAGGLSADAAKEYVAALKAAKRYQRDVY